MTDIINALNTLNGFFSEKDLTNWISNIENAVQKMDSKEFGEVLTGERVEGQIVQAALQIKSEVGQINTKVHALGILISLPHILKEDEKIVSLSLGAGSAGKDFDLETDKRVAEFKFAQWKERSNTIRQNSLFKDFFKLASYETEKERCLYVFDRDISLKFLNGKRALTSVLNKNQTIRQEFYDKYDDRYNIVSEYFSDVKNLVEIIELKEIVPVFREI